ncbi:MAG TPA: hypothetical protein DDY91_13590 [Planctomycetaceae bacterium]|nr:hypothetical protein [Planctomycetaceae bacterium]
MSQSPLQVRWTQQLARGLRTLSPGEAVVWASWLGLLLSVETLGGRFNDRWFDLGAGLSLLGWCLITVLVHNTRPLQLVSWMLRLIPSMKWWRSTLGFEWGVDLRRVPPLRRCLPPAWKKVALGLLVFSVLNALAVLAFPGGVRERIVPVFYLAFLVPWTITLGLSMFLASVMLFVIWAEIHDRAVSNFDLQGERPVQGEVLIMLACTATLLLAGLILPLWIPLAGMFVVALCVTVGLVMTSDDLVLVWRQEHRGRSGSFDGRIFIWFQAVAAIAVLANLTLLLGGGRELPFLGEWRLSTVFSPRALSDPARILTRITTWVCLGGTVAVGLDALQLALQGIWYHPRRMIEGEGQSLAPAASFETRRPVEIRCRRQLVRGLEHLFKRAARRRLPANSGLLLGLQHWFVAGLRTDANEDYFHDRDATVFDGIIGRPFHRVFSRQTRFHFWQITSALQIDLIYIERSVSFKRFVKVLRQMFEIYDMHGGTVRAEDLHFQGLTGVRVIIHDIAAGTIQPPEFENPRLANYPEPEYKELDRARVLHVFRERQESEVETPTPGESNWAPDLSHLF